VLDGFALSRTKLVEPHSISRDGAYVLGPKGHFRHVPA
jgi:hypothetical protein